MKIKYLLVLFSIISLTSCVTVWNKMEELKPIEEYATQNINIVDKTALDAEITFINDQTVKTKIKAEKNIFYKLVRETSIIKYFPIYDNQAKKNYISYELVKKMSFVDFAGETRIFINRGPNFKSLQEILYDGKIKWYREFYANAYDQSVQSIDHYVNENNQEVNVGLLNSVKNKLIEITSNKPELKAKIENTQKFDKNSIIEILKEYEN